MIQRLLQKKQELLSVIEKSTAKLHLINELLSEEDAVDVDMAEQDMFNLREDPPTVVEAPKPQRKTKIVDRGTMKSTQVSKTTSIDDDGNQVETITEII